MKRRPRHSRRSQVGRRPPRLYLIAIAVILLAAGASLYALHARHSTSVGGLAGLGDERFSQLVSGAPRGLRVRVDDLANNSVVPREYTCDGPDTPPRVTVSGLPAGNGTIVLIVYDPDAPHGTFIHWLAYHRVSAPAGGAATVFPSPSDVYGVNGFGRIGYGGPCPPPGETHHYVFLALYTRASIGLPQGYSLGDLLGVLGEDGVASWGYTVLVYSRG